MGTKFKRRIEKKDGISGIKILRMKSLICLIGFLIFITSLSCVCWGQTPTPTDVSSYVTVTTANERSTLDRRTGKITSTADVTITNKVDSGKIISSPLHAVITINNANGPVDMPEATGIYPDGRFYYDLSSRLTNNQLPPGWNVVFSVKFVRGSTVRFIYSVSTYAVIPPENQAPTANAECVKQNETLQARIYCSTDSLTLWGGLIQTAWGRVKGVGIPRLKRSGFL